MRTDADAQSEIIARIAHETEMPLEVVQHDYLETMRKLGDGARVRDYLSLFAARRVKAKLRDHKKS